MTLQVRVIAAHSSVIHGMSFDRTADHLATCADDGSVLVCFPPPPPPTIPPQPRSHGRTHNVLYRL